MRTKRPKCGQTNELLCMFPRTLKQQKKLHTISKAIYNVEESETKYFFRFCEWVNEGKFRHASWLRWCHNWCFFFVCFFIYVVNLMAFLTQSISPFGHRDFRNCVKSSLTIFMLRRVFDQIWIVDKEKGRSLNFLFVRCSGMLDQKAHPSSLRTCLIR